MSETKSIMNMDPREAEGLAWFTTVSGRKIFPDAIQPEDIDIFDIAHGLSNVCRFGGQCREFYSVAQHSVFVSQLVRPELSMVALMHDATEAYLGDVLRPIKRMLPQYQKMEKFFWLAIARKFDLPLEIPAEVKEADNVMLATERRDLMIYKGPYNEEEKHYLAIPDEVVPWSPWLAYNQFLQRYCFLKEILSQAYLSKHAEARRI